MTDLTVDVNTIHIPYPTCRKIGDELMARGQSVVNVTLVPGQLLNPQPGDVLILSYPMILSPEALDHLFAAVHAALPGVKVIILDGGAEWKLLRPLDES